MVNFIVSTLKSTMFSSSSLKQDFMIKWKTIFIFPKCVFSEFSRVLCPGAASDPKLSEIGCLMPSTKHHLSKSRFDRILSNGRLQIILLLVEVPLSYLFICGENPNFVWKRKKNKTQFCVVFSAVYYHICFCRCIVSCNCQKKGNGALIFRVVWAHSVIDQFCVVDWWYFRSNISRFSSFFKFVR